MKRKKPTVTRSSPEVEAAIKKLREFHDIGHRSLKRMLRIGHRGYGEELAKTDGEKAGINEDTLRKARQFATLYGDDELEELFRLCREHEVPLGTTYRSFEKNCNATSEEESSEKSGPIRHFSQFAAC